MRRRNSGWGMALPTWTWARPRWRELPESVPHTVLEVDEFFVVHHEEVPAVEEGVAFGQDVSQDLLLRLLGIARVAVEGGVLGDFDDQQPRLTFGEGEEGLGPVNKAPWCWRTSSPCPTGDAAVSLGALLVPPRRW